MFFYFLLYSVIFLIIPVVKEKIKVKLSLAIATGAPITVVKETIDTPPFVAEKTAKILSIELNAATYSLNFLLFNFLSLISC